MKEIVIPDLKCNEPESARNRPDKLLFSSSENTCGGDEYCAGRRIIENTCNALRDQKGVGGMDSRCVMVMVKVQLEALNKYLGIQKRSRTKQTVRVEDVESIIDIIKEENRMCLESGEERLSHREAFDLVTDLLLEKLYANKDTSRHFFGITVNQAETQSFQDLDPKILATLKRVLNDSYPILIAPTKGAARPG